MAEIKPKIVLLDKPYRILRWFVMNFDKEVGMVGLGEVKDGQVIVDKWVFPKQDVSYAHVSLDKEKAWNQLVKELSIEELQRMICFCHTHPAGMPGPSSVDENDSFDTWMNGRPIYSFIIAAKASNNSSAMEMWGRIDIRGNINASIPADVVYEDVDGVKEECEKIIAECITEPKYTNKSLADYDGYGQYDLYGRPNPWYGQRGFADEDYGDYPRQDGLVNNHRGLINQRQITAGTEVDDDEGDYPDYRELVENYGPCKEVLLDILHMDTGVAIECGDIAKAFLEGYIGKQPVKSGGSLKRIIRKKQTTYKKDEGVWDIEIMAKKKEVDTLCTTIVAIQNKFYRSTEYVKYCDSLQYETQK